jgi:hypothetical protein
VRGRQRIQIKSFVLDIPNLYALLSARDHKVTMVSGPLIGPPVEEPAPISRLYLRDILRNAADLGVFGEVDLRAAV